jgi:hypothetical protein
MQVCSFHDRVQRYSTSELAIRLQLKRAKINTLLGVDPDKRNIPLGKPLFNRLLKAGKRLPHYPTGQREIKLCEALKDEYLEYCLEKIL